MIERIFVLSSKSRFAVPLIRQDLFRLSHKDIEGAGITKFSGGKRYVKKDAGKVEDVHKKLNLDDLSGYMGGHIRSVAIYAEAMNLREFKHGSMTLISKEFPAYLISMPSELKIKLAGIVSDIWTRGGTIVLITGNKNQMDADYKLRILTPILEEKAYLAPIFYAPPLIQVLIYELGVAKNLDVDNTKNLTNVVTA